MYHHLTPPKPACDRSEGWDGLARSSMCARNFACFGSCGFEIKSAARSQGAVHGWNIKVCVVLSCESFPGHRRKEKTAKSVAAEGLKCGLFVFLKKSTICHYAEQAGWSYCCAKLVRRSCLVQVVRRPKRLEHDPLSRNSWKMAAVYAPVVNFGWCRYARVNMRFSLARKGSACVGSVVRRSRAVG